MDFKRKYVLILCSIIIVSAMIIAVIPNPGHGSNDFLITISGFTMTLQEAINGDYLVDEATSPTQDGTTSVSLGHDTSEVWVSVDGTENTLQSAVNGAGICGSSSVAYSGSINPGHLANQIEVIIDSVDMTLQQAIDSGEFCSVPEEYTYSYVFTSCGSCIGVGISTSRTCTKTCTRSCQRSDGVIVDCSFCGGVCSYTDTCTYGSCPTVCGDNIYQSKCLGTKLNVNPLVGVATINDCKVECGKLGATCMYFNAYPDDVDCWCYLGYVKSTLGIPNIAALCE